MEYGKPTRKIILIAGPRSTRVGVAVAQGKPVADNKQPENVRVRPRGRWYALCTLIMIMIAGALVFAVETQN